ncbi:MAG: hypothetical protein A2Y38_23470 [Spirochaetes bacterium GWB1_59_5]|nr:MAG: hypothetical protein A2Y38_23470 [Spirochaetes bacterium GWB1_59_5]
MQIYLTSYCNQGHEVATGKPVNHECHILPPAALLLEMADRLPEAVEALAAGRPLKRHSGLKVPVTEGDK